MKKTIKEDNNRNVVNKIYLNDNSLLEYVLENTYLTAVVRYIEYSKINEITLTSIKEEEFYNIFKMLKLNKNRTHIALFLKEEDNYVLSNIYDINDHSFVDLEFIDIVFDKEFSEYELDKNLVLKRR